MSKLKSTQSLINRANFFSTALTFSVWFVNGFFCKVLNLVPRHQQIVARILGEEHSILFTKIIGGLEVMMTVWVISNVKHRLCVFVQILLIAAMNIIEFFCAPDLLLFGRLNIVVAAGFILLLCATEGWLAFQRSKPKLHS